MGKAKKIKVSKGKEKFKTIPLGDQIENDQIARPKNRLHFKLREEKDDEFVDANLSQKILLQARKQRQELEGNEIAKKQQLTKLGPDLSDDELSAEEDVTGNEYYKDVEIDEEEERALQMFMNKGNAPTRRLGDFIKETLSEKKSEIQKEFSDAGGMETHDLDPRIHAVMAETAKVLKTYRSGKLPKVFKIIPTMRNWEQLLEMTEPTEWSAATMYQATRIFSSNLKSGMAQRFFNLVLLPRIRDDIAEYKRLNVHLYQALKKSLFKPSAFIKGILLPLLASGDCTLREAVIIGSIVGEYSIHILHSAAAIEKIATMEYSGANSIFLRILLDKKYALPYRVVDGVVQHFLRFEKETRELPVLWHQSLLTFVQRYKNDITLEQKEALFELLKKQRHHIITDEIRRELNHAKCRDAKINENIDEPMTS